LAAPCGHVTMPPSPLTASASKIFILFTCFVIRLVPRHLAGNEDGGRAHPAERSLRAGNGGRGLPALAQAARATCRLARGVATHRGVFFDKKIRR
jgi:hypothetical protein